MRDIEEKIDDIIEKYASKFGGFRKKRWYIEWVAELEDFLNEVEKAKERVIKAG